jgi:hypothetical protein
MWTEAWARAWCRKLRVDIAGYGCFSTHDPDVQLLLTGFRLRWPLTWRGEVMDYEFDPSVYETLPHDVQLTCTLSRVCRRAGVDWFLHPKLAWWAVKTLEEEGGKGTS